MLLVAALLYITLHSSLKLETPEIIWCRKPQDVIRKVCQVVKVDNTCISSILLFTQNAISVSKTSKVLNHFIRPAISP